MSLKLLYEDIAMGAADDAAVTTSTTEDFSEVDRLPFGVYPPAIATLELNGWGLTHDYKARGNQNIAFWSAARSGADCTFTTPPTITFNFDNQYSAPGISLTFAPGSNDYCPEISVTWYQGTTVKASGTYYPESTNAVIEQLAEAFNKIVITLNKTNLPGRRAKVERIVIGAIRSIETDEIREAKFLYETSPISDTIPVNVLDANLASKTSISYLFHKRQPVTAYMGDNLIGVYYINTSKRHGAQTYGLSCDDIIGILDLETQDGGLWLTDTALTTVLDDIIGASVDFEIDAAYSTATIKGFIEPGSKRAALQQICFALGAVADTSGSRKVKIFPLPSGTGEEIANTDIYTGGAVDQIPAVTEVDVTAYTITDTRPQSGDKYITYNDVDYKYTFEVKTALNPDAVASDMPNKIKFDKSFLVNQSNAQTLANNIMARYQRQQSYSFRHIVDGQKPGDRVTAELPWGGNVSGNVIKMSISVTGIVVSDTEMLLD